jgi:hypothetical protein
VFSGDRGDGSLQEQRTLLCDMTRAFRYKISRSAMPCLNYHAGARLCPISDSNTTFTVRTADRIAAPKDDVRLIPMVHQDVFQKVFDTISASFLRELAGY